MTSSKRIATDETLVRVAEALEAMPSAIVQTKGQNEDKVMSQKAVTDELENYINVPIMPSAGFHNSLYRGKNVTSYWNDGTLHSRIQGINGFNLFEDLFVGDYFSTGSATINGVTKTWWWVIAGFDLRLSCGIPGESGFVSTHHVVLLPCSSDGTQNERFGKSAMYDSIPFTRAYEGSKAHQLMISGGGIATGLQGIFGGNLLPSLECISTANDSYGYGRYGSASGVSTACAWRVVYAILLSEVEVYGSIIWSSSGCDGLMSSRGRLPLLRFCPWQLQGAGSVWLRDVTGAISFCSHDGTSSAAEVAATQELSLSPRFLIK